ncbi:MAG TPA: hypothetical protein VLL07_04410 [Pontiella sp.]|nr:hypothetical protein [Pontiella sp.]
MALLAFSGSARDGFAQSVITDEALESVATAEAAVANAKASIKRGRELVALIPEDSPLLPEVRQMLKEVSVNWKLAVESVEGANLSAAKIEATKSDGLAKDYALLAKVNAAVATSGANVVEIGMAYVEAVATDKTESLDIIRGTMQDALAASSQVKFNCDKVKSLISKKYSN